MLDDTRRRSLASVAEAVNWTAEQRGQITIEHALGRADPSPDCAGRFDVELADRAWDPTRDRDLRLRFADGSAQPVDRVVRAGTGVLVVEVDRPVAEGSATLMAVNDAGLVPRALAERLTALEELGLAGSIIDGRLDPAPSERSGSSKLNDQQRRAVATIASPGAHVIWGPPGTGKTSVIADAVASVVADGGSALVLSPSTLAVDAATTAIDDLLVAGTGTVVRVGVPRRADVADHPSLILERAVAARRQPIQRDIDRIDRRLADLERSHLATEWRSLIDKLERADVDSLQNAWRRIAGVDRVRHLEAEIIRITELIGQRSEELVDLRAEAERVAGLLSLDPAEVWQQIDQARADDATAQATMAVHDRAKQVAQSARDAAIHRLGEIPTIRLVERRRASAEVDAQEIELRRTEEAQRRARDDYDERHSDFCRRLVELQHQLPPECDAEWWADLHGQQTAATSNLQAAEEEKAELEAELERLEAELVSVRADPPTPVDYDVVQNLAPQLPELRARRDELADANERLEARQVELRRQREELMASVDAAVGETVDEAAVVTLNLSTLPLEPTVLERTFDVVVVDEAANAELPLLVLAASLATSGVAIVGDFCLTGPTPDPKPGLHSTNSEGLSADARYWLTAEPFHHLGLRRPADADNERGCVSLTRQYRFGKAVETAANRLVYGGGLWSGPRWHNPIDDGQGELVLIDSSTLGRSQQWIVQDGPSRHWPLGVLLAARITELHRDTSIGIIAPYQAQADLLRALIADSGRRTQVEAGTIGQLQGREFDVVVLDLVSSTWRTGDLATSDGADGDAPPSELRAAAAALTCTRGRTYLIGDIEPHAKDLPEASFFSVLREMRGRGLAVVDALELLDDERLMEGSAPIGTSPGDVGKLVRVYPKASFYSRLDELAAQCHQRLDVWSPYYTERRIRTLGRRWASAARNGRVHARVLSPRTDEEQTALAALERTGVVVARCDEVNEKLVIGDGHLVLWGSLNVLSSNRRTELMTEIDSPALARLLRARADGLAR